MGDCSREEVKGRMFSSQPVSKTASWAGPQTLKISTQNLPKTAIGASSSTIPSEDQHPNPVENRFVVSSLEGSKNWSKDAAEFYHNGDAPFCYTHFLSKKLDTNFWGALLGYQSNGHLSFSHVEAWTVRMMRIRQSKLLRDPSSKLRWTVLPPQFIDAIRDIASSMIPFCNALKEKPYPPLRAIDHVYLPLLFKEHDWLLVRVDMQTMTITQYLTDKRWRTEKRIRLHNKMGMLTHCFRLFLEHICYRQRFNLVYKTELTVGRPEVNVPQDKGNIANTGVLVCMMMDKLVRNQPLVIEDDIDNACVNYRRHMADELYKWRCVPSTMNS